MAIKTFLEKHFHGIVKFFGTVKFDRVSFLGSDINVGSDGTGYDVYFNSDIASTKLFWNGARSILNIGSSTNDWTSLLISRDARNGQIACSIQIQNTNSLSNKAFIWFDNTADWQDSWILGNDLTDNGSTDFFLENVLNGYILRITQAGLFTVTGTVKATQGFISTKQSIEATNSELASNTIGDAVNSVLITGVDVDANDFVVLPSLANVEDGHVINILCAGSSNFELRTPALSNEKINNVDADGTNEYLCTDTDTVRIWKVSNTQGWVAQSITNLGAVRTAVVPD